MEQQWSYPCVVLQDITAERHLKVYLSSNNYWRFWQCIWVQIAVHFKSELQNSQKSGILWA